MNKEGLALTSLKVRKSIKCEVCRLRRDYLSFSLRAFILQPFFLLHEIRGKVRRPKKKGAVPNRGSPFFML